MAEPADVSALELVSPGVRRREADFPGAVFREDDFLELEILAGEAVLGIETLEGDLHRLPGFQLDPVGLELVFLRRDGDLAGLGRKGREQKWNQKKSGKARSGDSRNTHGHLLPVRLSPGLESGFLPAAFASRLSRRAPGDEGFNTSWSWPWP